MISEDHSPTEAKDHLVDLPTYNTEREAAPLALVGDLVAQIVKAEAEPIFEADGVAVLRDGTALDWRDKLDRPTRRRGNVILADPESFVAYLDRFSTSDTLIYASIDDSQIVAVLNDHPEYPDGTGGAEAVKAGRRDDIAQLVLKTADDWAMITRNNGRLIPQREFAELIEDLAHTVVSPDSATMLEVAATLNVRQNIDFGSRVRTESGDVEFRFERTSEASAGRGSDRIEIPTVIAFSSPVWVGTEPVRIEARLRFRAGSDGCVMGYRLMRLGDVTEQAFRGVVGEIDGGGVAPATLYGDPMVRLAGRTGR